MDRPKNKRALNAGHRLGYASQRLSATSADLLNASAYGLSDCWYLLMSAAMSGSSASFRTESGILSE